MRIKIVACLLFITIFVLPLLSETLVVSERTGSSAWIITLVSAYQMNDEIWVTSDIEKAYSSGYTEISYPVDMVEVSLPSIVSKHVGDLEIILSERPLYIHRQQVNTFDFTSGDGWVDTDITGWLYIRHYPMVYQGELKWLYVRESIVVDDISPIYPGQFLGIKRLSYNFYSDQFGWLWKSPYTDLFFVYELREYLSIEELLERFPPD